MVSSEGPEGGRRKPPLNLRAVLRAAVDFADREGVERLSMRKLAEVLGVEAMSLYHHVPNKAAILDGMVDEAFSEVELPDPETDWRTAMRLRAVSTREVLLRHRWALGLMESRKHPGPATLRHHNAVLGSLRHGGFTIAQAARAFSLIDSYLYGFVLQEITLPFQGQQGLHDVAGPLLEEMPADEFPHLAELVTDHVLQPGYDYSNEFEPGLDIVLDGVERLKSVSV